MDQKETFIKIDKIIKDWQKNKKTEKRPTQQYVSDQIPCSVGKMNGLMKKFDEWEKSQNVF